MLKTILLLNPVYVTFFWALVLNFYRKSKHTPKAFLGKFMTVAFLLYLSHLLYFSNQLDVYRYFDSLYTWASLLVFPLYHIYIRLLTVEKTFSLSHHAKFLLLPTLIFILHLGGVLALPKQVHMDYLQMGRSGLLMASFGQQYMHWIYQIARAAFILQVGYYLYANFMLIVKNNHQLQDFYSNTEDRSLRWVQLFNFSLAITSIASILAAFLGRQAFSDGTLSLAVPSLVFSILLFFIGLSGNTQKALHTTTDEKGEESIPVEDTYFAHLKDKLVVLFEEEKIFKNADLKIWDVCNMLGTNRTYVSRLINIEYQRNFCNHVNYYRVKYAKEIAQENPELSNEQIADLSGFGSQNSLYRAFMTLEGVSLKQFRKKKLHPVRHTDTQ